jgi:hypothetical protein
MAVQFVSCAKNDNNNEYWCCEQLLDTAGLKLYPFVPFTDEEMRFTSAAYQLERRQISEDFLCKMTAKELFYQVVYTEFRYTFYNIQETFYVSFRKKI